MSVITYTEAINQFVGPDALFVTWAAMATGDTGTPYPVGGWGGKTVQIDGTFGGSTVTIEGSNDGTTYYGLSDQAAAAISRTTAAMKVVLENTRYIRPVVTGGSAVVIKVTLCARKA